MQHSQKSNTLATGLAMFSMFFGAGNVVFPLALGQLSQDNNFFALLGLLITAVGVPFIGLIAMTLFDGQYQHFFERIGKTPGFIVSAIIMAVLGFGALPRCIALSYSTAETYIPHISLTVFSIASCIIIFLFTFRRNSIIEMLGYVLTPFLLLSLSVIIIKGLIDSPAAPAAQIEPLPAFLHGFNEGYQTMDLLGAFFFSSVVLACLKEQAGKSEERKTPSLIKQTLKASCIGALLLSLIYIGFSYVAAFNSEVLKGAPAETLINSISHLVLGPYAGLIVCVAVALACLTTAIALASVFAEFIHEDLTQFKVSYVASLAVTLVITAFIATLNFSKIMSILGPVLEAIYPALIVLSFVNILYKLYNFKPVKTPFAITLGLTILAFIL